MPIYEFMSRETGKIYSFFAHSTSYSDKTPECPDGKKYKMEKVMSGFSITGKKEEPQDMPEQGSGDDPNDPFAGMDPNQAEKVMKELEGAMGGMDEDNPDPKQMGQLMRKMCEMTGETRKIEWEISWEMMNHRLHCPQEKRAPHKKQSSRD